MRLSEELILGGTLATHTPHPSWDDTHGCALQLAAMARGTGDHHQPMVSAVNTHRWTRTLVPCPACGELDRIYYIIAAHLNDKHRWNLDRIAEWVASVEPKEIEAALETEHEFDKEVLRHLGLPEEYVPEDENEAYRLIIAALED